ncbi:MAG: hypothetical protein KC486_14560 [Myxococcales bacterium]|nr:hypothetical protein [Myxococcales bacterium]
MSIYAAKLSTVGALVLALAPLACGSPAPARMILGAGESGGATTTTTGTAATSTAGDAASVGTTTGDDSSGTSAASVASTGGGPALDVGVPDLGESGTICNSKLDVVFAVARMYFFHDEVYPPIADALPAMIAALDEAFAAYDLHVLVVDGSDRWGSKSCSIDQCSLTDGCLPISEPNYPCDVVHEFEELPECESAGGAGVIFPAGKLATNAPCDFVGDRRFFTREEPDFAATFLCAATTGTTGSFDGIGWDIAQAVSDKLNLPGGCNEGFLREDAHLLIVSFTAGGGGGPYNPLSWSGVVLDAKGGEQGAVSVISYVNEVYVPGYCAEPHRGSAMYEFAKYFDNHHLIGVCAEDLVEPFVDAVDEVAAYCDAPR